MVNGYALPSRAGLTKIYHNLKDREEHSLDLLRGALRIGLHWDTQVTLEGATHTVSQAYCSALPVAHTTFEPDLWEPFATVVLEAAYEATLCAAILNRARTGNGQLYLTMLGGGAFGNSPDWITHAMRRSLELYSEYGLDVSVVSFGASNRSVRKLVGEFL